MTNCTVSGNSATDGDGGGVANIGSGRLTMTNCTVSGNAASSRGGGVIHIPVGPASEIPGLVTLTNTIVANSVGGDVYDTSAGSPLAGSHNLIEDGSGGLPGTITGDPLLGPLADNGGPTLTHALLPGSPAIDAGINGRVPVAFPADQRGAPFARMGGTAVDIGASEVQSPVVIAPAAWPTLAGGPSDGTARRLDPAPEGRYQTGDRVPFFPDFTGPVRPAVADVNGDGVPDYIGAAGPGGGPRVRVIDGAAGVTLADFLAFEPAFTGGVYVAAGDIDGDGKADLVVTPDQGGGPVVAVFSGSRLAGSESRDLGQLARFFGIDDPSFRGGARPALGDVNGDGTVDLVISAGFQGGPRVALFDGAGVTAQGTPPKLAPDFFAFEPGLRNGVFVAAGDLIGDGQADLAFGGGPGGAPRARVFDGAKLLAAGSFGSLDAIASAAQAANFFAGDAASRGGVRLAARDADRDGKADLVTGSGEGEPSAVRVYKWAGLLGSSSPPPDQTLDPFGAALADGVFVG
jgi:hypothetical protein